jgi:hypothetical protein
MAEYDPDTIRECIRRQCGGCAGMFGPDWRTEPVCNGPHWLHERVDPRTQEVTGTFRCLSGALRDMLQDLNDGE